MIDGYRNKVIPEAYVDITSVMDTKRSALAEHQSQHSWLETSQGMNSYLGPMDEMSEKVGLFGEVQICRDGEGGYTGFVKRTEPLRDALGDIYYSEPNYLRTTKKMARKSTIAPDWWDYTTLEDDIISDAASLTAKFEQLSRPGFRVVFYDTLEDFYLAEALEYISAWKEATSDNPVGICGPIGPTEQLPLVARLVNELNINLSDAHFWGMDEWR